MRLLGYAAGALFLCLRLVLLAEHPELVEQHPLGVLRALLMGTVHDALVVTWILVPIALYAALMPLRWEGRPLERWVRSGGFFFLTLALLFSLAAEWFFFQEFDSRFNFVAVDYLVYPTEVVTNIWESYPTGWILGTLVVLSASAVWFGRRSLHRASGPRWRRVGLAAGLLATGLVGSWAISPAWGVVSQSRVVNEIARNGIYTFCAALRGSYASFEGLYAEMPEELVFARLHALLSEENTAPGSFLPSTTSRQIDNPGAERRLNVVVVLEESLGSEFVGVLRRGAAATLTPSLDALAASGTLLSHAYSTGNRTIRAIEATTSGLPPLPGISIVRRPQSEGLFTLPALLRSRGYDTSFIYGGRALFDGMGGYLSRNGVERVVDQADYPEGTFATAWGVADEAIFTRALEEFDRLDREGRPFYSLVLSVTNHRPFTFPAGRVEPRPELGGRENAVRYADFALGQFMAAAQTRPWFENTLFVLMGDHGARVYGSAVLPLASYEVPILFIGPGIPRGQRLDTLTSSLDIPPTILARLGMDYTSKFFGRDVFTLEPSQGRALMTHNTKVALLEGSQLAVLDLQSSTGLYTCDLAAPSCSAVADGAGSSLVDDAIAYYSGADLLYRTGGYGELLTAHEVARLEAGRP